MGAMPSRNPVDAPVGGWSLDTLRHYIESKLEAIKESVAAALATSDKAITKAEAATEKRLDLLNEFRRLVSDMIADLLPRRESATLLTTLNDKIDALHERMLLIERFQAEHGGRRVQGDSDNQKIFLFIGLGLSLILSACAVATLFLR